MGCCMSNRTNNDYSVEFKKKAVQLYPKGGGATENWQKIKKRFADGWQKYNVESRWRMDEVRQRTSTRGKSRTKFSSLEEKLAYLEAERDYLKNCIAPGSGTNGERTKKLLLQDN